MTAPTPRLSWRLLVAALGLAAIAAGGWLYYRSTHLDPLSIKEQNQLQTDLTHEFATAEPTMVKGKPAPAKPLPDGALALIRIPRFGATWQRAVLADVTLTDLAKGPGHYPTSQMPGQPGNFAVAGHAWGPHGWFNDLPQMKAGDKIVVETVNATYTYKTTWREIVLPTDTGPIQPVPDKPGVVPQKSMITLQTCYPVPADDHRMMWHGVLVKVTPRA